MCICKIDYQSWISAQIQIGFAPLSVYFRIIHVIHISLKFDMSIAGIALLKRHRASLS